MRHWRNLSKYTMNLSTPRYAWARLCTKSSARELDIHASGHLLPETGQTEPCVYIQRRCRVDSTSAL